MGKVLTAVIGALLYLLTPAIATAAQWYQVEVIIFAQQDSFGNEGAPQSIHLRYPAQATHFGGGELQRLPQEQRLLNADAAKLERTGVYRVLFHEAWRQPGQSQGRTPWLIIQGGRPLGNHYELEGSLRLYLSTYLHLATNLWLSRASDQYPSAAASPDAGAHGGYARARDLPPAPTALRADTPVLAGAGPAAITLKDVHTLEHSTRLLLGKLHYVDHPRMGILVKVRRAEAPGSPASAEPAAKASALN